MQVNEPRRIVQIRTFPTIHDAIKKICIDRHETMQILMERIMRNEIAPLRVPLTSQYFKRIAPANERLTRKINFEFYSELWSEFVRRCQDDYGTRPTNRVNALLNREILEHHTNYLKSEEKKEN